MSATAGAEPASTERLEKEGALLARYLVGRGAGNLTHEILERYARGCARLLSDRPDPRDHAMTAFACRHPWSLPFLDGACGLIQPRSLLRDKLILMLAILETSPEHWRSFVPSSRSRPVALARLAGLGAAGVFKAALGLLLLPLARAGR